MRLSRADRKALKKALEMTLGEEDRRGQIEHKLEHDGWFEAATFSAYHQQCQNLHLRPWESPPCWLSRHDRPGPGREHAREAEAIRLCKQLHAAGLSRYEPDPIGALAAKRELRSAQPTVDPATESAVDTPPNPNLIAACDKVDPPAGAQVLWMARPGGRG
jgi:hypothetical protein